MVAAIYGSTRVCDTSAAGDKALPRKDLWRRFMDALIASRLQQARREIHQHRHLLPYAYYERGESGSEGKSGDAVIGGW